jgi:pimeloyl-ACP methyl ester carboxylesterase
MRSGFIDSDGLQIYYEQVGTGLPMILVHGWGADTQSNWVDTGWVNALKHHRTVISIDVRGHGKSAKPHTLGPYSYAEMSRDVLNVMDALTVEKADFMGYSMGSFMGAYLLGHYPERFTSMVLGGIGNETQSSAAQGSVIARALRATDPASIDNSAGKSVRRFVETNPNNDLEALACSALKMWPEGYPLKIAGEHIGQADFPVLIVNGDQDYPYVDSADDIAAALPRARHKKLPGADHLSAVTHPLFKDIVIDFLNARKIVEDTSDVYGRRP